MSAIREVTWFKRFPNGGTVYVQPADSPKGPESEVRPGFTKYERYDLTTWAYAAAHSIEVYEVDRSDGGFEDLERELLDAHELQNQGLAALLGLPGEADDGDIADEITRQRSEVERLTAEVERLREAGRVIARSSERFFHANADKTDQIERLQAQYDQAVEDWGRNDEQMLAENQRLTEEVSRLREQLAAAQALVADFRRRAEQTVATFGEDGQHDDECDSPVECHASAQHFTWKLAATALEKAVSASVSESVPVTPQLPSGSALIDDLGLSEQQSDNLVARIATLTAEFAGRIRQAMPVWQQHDEESGETFSVVQVRHAAKVAARITARLELNQGSLRASAPSEASQLQANSKLEQTLDEGRPSGSERLAPRQVETFDCKQDCPAVAPECFCVGTEPHRLCCHENAAQAARSEATLQESQPRVWPPGSLAPGESVTAVIGENDVTFTRTSRDEWHARPPEGNGSVFSWAYINQLMTLTEVLPSAEQEAKK